MLPQTPAAEPVGWQTLLFAFLGGLLLNLMPCVFPVLAMKATAVARLSGGERRQVRLSGLAYSLGVLVAFLTLAAILLALRAGGSSLGWGFQFQSPLFVVVLCWLILAIGLNLSGVYEIGTSLTGAGQTLASRPGHAGSFFTGLLAVVVATPCTAPFMGAALGAALTASPMVCLALFATLGLGLAAPFALISLPENGIANRQSEIATRATFGHWDCDLIIFARQLGKANVTSLQERKTRFLVLLSNENRQSAGVIGQISKALSPLPRSACQTVTFDRGTEFLSYKALNEL